MKAVKAEFDGERIILPRDLHIHTRGEVIVIFNDARDDAKGEWTAAQEEALRTVWDKSARRRV